uniref:Uncharacterized protein n=1 Tax=Anguilla anguilla TaxID=7936 RepID=A0A0E9PPD0_ANGAN
MLTIQTPKSPFPQR